MLPKYVHTSARFRATCHRPLFAAPDQPNTSGNSKRRILFDIRRCSDVKLLSFVLNTCHIIVIRAVPIHSVISLAQSWQILGWSSSRRSRRCINGNRRRLSRVVILDPEELLVERPPWAINKAEQCFRRLQSLSASSTSGQSVTSKC